MTRDDLVFSKEELSHSLENWESTFPVPAQGVCGACDSTGPPFQPPPPLIASLTASVPHSSTASSPLLSDLSSPFLIHFVTLTPSIPCFLPQTHLDISSRRSSRPLRPLKSQLGDSSLHAGSLISSNSDLISAIPVSSSPTSSRPIPPQIYDLERDIRFELLARLCPNSTGADIRSVCTEAGMYAIRARRKTVTEKDFLDAVNKVIKGYQKFSATPKYMVYN